jgi:hypothetical protein
MGGNFWGSLRHVISRDGISDDAEVGLHGVTNTVGLITSIGYQLDRI